MADLPGVFPESHPLLALAHHAAIHYASQPTLEGSVAIRPGYLGRYVGFSASEPENDGSFLVIGQREIEGVPYWGVTGVKVTLILPRNRKEEARRVPLTRLSLEDGLSLLPPELVAA